MRAKERHRLDFVRAEPATSQAGGLQPLLLLRDQCVQSLDRGEGAPERPQGTHVACTRNWGLSAQWEL